jgi:hypothetical protein
VCKNNLNFRQRNSQNCQCEECNRNFKNKKGLKIHRTRIHGLMGQSFLCESFSSKIDKTRRKNETINQTPPTSMDYEKQSGPEDSQPDGSHDYVVLYVLENHLRITTD